MLLILDAYNIVLSGGPFDVARSLQTKRQKLLDLACVYAATKKGIREIIAVFDGRDDVYPVPHKVASLRVKVMFSHGSSDADQTILRLLDRLESPKGCFLVTNDVQLRNEARALGAHVLPVDELLKRFKTQTAKKSPVPRESKNLDPLSASAINEELSKKWGDD